MWLFIAYAMSVTKLCINKYPRACSKVLVLHLFTVMFRIIIFAPKRVTIFAPKHSIILQVYYLSQRYLIFSGSFSIITSNDRISLSEYIRLSVFINPHLLFPHVTKYSLLLYLTTSPHLIFL